MDRLRLGFIGAGTIANWHAERVDNLGHDIRGVADIDPTSRREFADQFDVPATYEDYKEMIAHSDLDIVVVSVPNSLHADCAVAALEADLDVFIEKPVADTLEAALTIEEAESESDGNVFVGFMKAFDPGIEAMCSMAGDGEFGDIHEVDIEYVRRRGVPQIGSWFTRKDTAGGGVVIDIGVHMIHLSLAVLGFPDLESVSATAGAYFGGDDYTYLDMWGGDPIEDGEFSVEDTARALIRTENDETIHLHCAWASNTDPVQRLKVLGDEAGAMTFPESDREAKIYSTRRSGLSDEALEFPERDLYSAEWEYFTEVVQGDREHTRNTLEEGLQVQRVVDAIYRSTADQCEVPIEPEAAVATSD